MQESLAFFYFMIINGHLLIEINLCNYVRTAVKPL
ncbi:MAG: hypothetical protein K0R98_1081 [Rickettsiaceae bacterium]|jgi:hypothetical protein|nr:hypothetical protein [Rickettsiaceae bacterium]